MELTKEQKRLLLHFQWKLELNASEAAKKSMKLMETEQVMQEQLDDGLQSLIPARKH
jgi:hypothetical protein